MKTPAKAPFVAEMPQAENRTFQAFRLFGVSIHRSSLPQAVEHVTACVRNGIKNNVAFVNADCLNKACTDDTYRQVLQGFDKVYADGSGIRTACRVKGWPLPDNVNGTDMFPLLCGTLAAQGASLFLLGGRPGVAEACAMNMQKRHQGLRIAGTQHGYFPPEATRDVISRINESEANVLLVGFGAPSQEFWIYRHSHELTPAVRICVGGLFDFYSGRIPRAPWWLRRIGLEWTWRLAQEPARMWRRYLLGNPLFLLRVLLPGR